MIFDYILNILIIIVFILVILRFVKKAGKSVPAAPKKTVASDGHVLKGYNDPTCARYGHEHKDLNKRYIVHDEPVEGYVNLNGKLMTLKEAAKY